MVELPPPPFREHKQIWSENNEMKLKIEVFEGLGFSRIDGGLRFFFSDPPPPIKKNKNTMRRACQKVERRIAHFFLQSTEYTYYMCKILNKK